MPEWLVEEGIAETRALLIENENIVAARVEWPGELVSGEVAEAVVISRQAGATRGTARLTTGEEILVERLTRDASEGQSLTVEITRPAIGEHGRLKRARARPSDAAPAPAPKLLDRLRSSTPYHVRVVRGFPGTLWDELIAEAFAAEVHFAGGALQFSATPAMLLVDVDGALDPRSLALAAVVRLAHALRRFDIGGPVGIDFPTLTSKADRRAVDDALESALADWPHERTAMNGFGFVQLVARLERPSLLHRATFQRAAMAARLLMRRAERLEGAGAIELCGHWTLAQHIAPAWLDELSRRAGRDVRWRAEDGLAVEAPHSQLVAR